MDESYLLIENNKADSELIDSITVEDLQVEKEEYIPEPEPKQE
nr:hypothetical protein [Clostridium estertheticum]